MRVSLSTSLSVCLLGYLSIYPASCCARSDLVGCVPWFVCGIPLAWLVVVGVPCLYVGAFDRLSPPLVDALRAAAEWRKNKPAASEYDETTSPPLYQLDISERYQRLNDNALSALYQG